MTEPVEKISVFGTDEAVSDRGPFKRLGRRVDIPVEELQERVTTFLESMSKVLGKAPAAVSGFELDQVQVTAELSAKGTVSLLGTGGEVAGKGGLVFTFKRGTH